MLLLLILSFTLPGVENQGDRIFYNDARSLAFGGVSSVLEHSNNPAAIALADEILIFTSASITTASEKRGLRVYDSYGNNMTISTVSKNIFAGAHLEGSSVVLPIRFIRIAFKYCPLWDLNYSFRSCCGWGRVCCF